MELTVRKGTQDAICVYLRVLVSNMISISDCFRVVKQLHHECH